MIISLIVAGILALVMIVDRICEAIENIKIAKYEENKNDIK